LVVTIVMFCWPLVVVMLFAQLPPRRAVIWAMLMAWLFLPIAEFKTPGIPIYSKMTATSYGIILGILFFDLNRVFQFRMSWVDLPAVIWCLCPGLSSVVNDLGLYDAQSAVLGQTVTWGVPYFIGRLYFTDSAAVKELALALVLGGLIYVPLCLFEVRMSPQLHIWIYGYHQASFAQEIRYGGFRPTVFMEHGLMVGMWMCMTTLIAGWMWWNGQLPKIFGVSALAQVATLAVTSVLCKSTGAIVLLAVGALVILATTMLNTRVLMLCLICTAPLYIALRCTGTWDGQSLVSLSSQGDRDRAQSLDFRLQNENMLMQKALRQPVFGWAGWGRSRIYDENGKDMSITDGLWIIALGNFGIVGLSALTLSLLLPALLMVFRTPPNSWSHPDMAAPAVCCVVTTLYMIDNIPNAMVNPIFAMVAGAICTLSYTRWRRCPPMVEDRFARLPQQRTLNPQHLSLNFQ
jgi:hypothetical protein